MATCAIKFNKVSVMDLCISMLYLYDRALYAMLVNKVSILDSCVSMLHFLTVILKCVPGEVHFAYVMTSCRLHCTCILPVVYQVVICFFHFVGR